MDFSTLSVSSGDWAAWGGLFVLVPVAIATRRESRVLMAAIAGCILAPTAATLYVVALLAIVWRLIDAINVGRS